MALPSSGAISLAMIQAEFGGANPISLSEYYKGGAYVTASDVAPNVPSSGIISLANFHGAFKNVIGQIEYTTPGTYTWTVPASVSSVCVVCIGCGGDGGGSLSWGNNIPVSAGQQFTIKVGDDNSKISYFGSTGILYANIGADRGGAYMGGGGNGGSDGGLFNGGGGTGGYTGNGGNGGGAYSAGASGSGGGGGGGGGAYPDAGGTPAGGGGGTGILGQGANGAGGSTYGSGGGGGSGGENGVHGLGGANGGYGGKYGGGPAGTGAVRIIWGAYRSFPSTNTGNL